MPRRPPPPPRAPKPRVVRRKDSAGRPYHTRISDGKRVSRSAWEKDIRRREREREKATPPKAPPRPAPKPAPKPRKPPPKPPAPRPKVPRRPPRHKPVGEPGGGGGGGGYPQPPPPFPKGIDERGIPIPEELPDDFDGAEWEEVTDESDYEEGEGG